MKFKWAWRMGFGGAAVAIILVALEHLDLKHFASVDQLIPAFKYFDYPAYLAAPWIVDHLPFITHGEFGASTAEVYFYDGFYILISGIEWFVLGVLAVLILRKFRTSTTSNKPAK